ncbi:3-dehydroquinate synthase [Thermostilla marina]
MSDAFETVHVALGPASYDIRIGSGTLPETAAYLREQGVTHSVIITDDNVMDPHGQNVAEHIIDAGIDVSVMVVPAGEVSKSIDMANTLWQEMLREGTDRKSVVVAVGGGVVGDLAGFVAATFARGIRFLQVPTSLLAQVDSSVGGKVGINLAEAKNMVGAFLQPMRVQIDIDTLSTLPPREYISGLGEVVKYGVILDEALFADLEANVAGLLDHDPDVLRRIVARCCRLKADVVEADEKETSGRRAILNYGHTFAHAVETLAGYGELLHGEAVAIGMRCAAELAVELGMFDAESAARQQKLLEALRLPTSLPASLNDPDAAYECMRHDKKVQHGRLRLILPTRIGEVVARDDVDEAVIKDVWARCVG